MPDTTAPHGSLQLSTAFFGLPVTNDYGLRNVGIYASPSFVDIDGDGDMDAFVGNYDGNTQFFKNTGSASRPAFAVQVANAYGLSDVGISANPSFVDIDGDGDLDAFLGNSVGNTLVFLNTGSVLRPAFAAPVTNPYHLADVGASANPTFVDIDNDGDLDAFVGNSAGNTLVFLNTGCASSPAFAARLANRYGLSDVGAYASPSFVDIDGDGDLDAFVGERYGNTLVFLNTGNTNNPAFAAPTTNPYRLSDAGGSASPSFVDLDGDGDLDVVVGNSDGNTLVFLGNSFVAPVATDSANRTYGVGSVITLTIAFNENVLVDTTGGTPTLKLETGRTDQLAFYSGGSGTQTLIFSYTVQAGDASADLDSFSNSALTLNGGTIQNAAGNNADLSLADPGSTGSLAANAALVIDTAAPRGTLPATPVFSSPVTNGYGLSDVGRYAIPSLFDIDGDGDLDAFVGNKYGQVQVYLNTGSASSPAFAAPLANAYGLSDVGISASPSLVDIDSDGDLDAFLGNRDGNTLFFLNTGNASSPAFAAPLTNAYGLSDVGTYAKPNLVDIDGDGDLDAFIGERYGNTLLFLNTGSARSPAFASPVTNPYGLASVGFSTSPSLVDMDGDGDLDAFIGERYGNTLVFLNTGNVSGPAFAAPVSKAYGLSDVGYYASPSLVDIDGDGDLDALVGNSVGNTLVFLNTGSFVAPVSSSSTNGTYIVGSVISLSVTFNENVLVNTTGGTPTLKLETGATDRFATYSSGSGTGTLTFSYTVQQGDTSADLDIFSSSALTLNGGTIRNALGNNATLTLAAPGATGSLAANAELVVSTSQTITGSSNGESLSGGSLNDTLDGAGGDDRLHSLAGNDSLLGGNGRDVLSGGTGADTMAGGDGNDFYYVDDAGDRVIETNASPDTGGTDTIYSYINRYSLPDNIERGTIKTSQGASLAGNKLDNRLYGGLGNDNLNGAVGNDSLWGHSGADTFVFNASSGNDFVNDFSRAQGDKISLQHNINGSGITDAAGALARVSDVGGHAVLDLGNGNQVSLTGIHTADLTAADFMVF